eukprot:CAMPEP_0180390144 /NCGR_PEP_ID=MMETSP0989-20121125/31819_1 /TAXON_ID=697907 /ORGANISM="non described non described, Strain CCMP2293" /LENGTH=96 /DNA_ID=CAMNT_0022391461 /DNA_START=54 /DNA_END=340 /DNA_ORIENTATION=+
MAARPGASSRAADTCSRDNIPGDARSAEGFRIRDAMPVDAPRCWRPGIAHDTRGQAPPSPRSRPSPARPGASVGRAALPAPSAAAPLAHGMRGDER